MKTRILLALILAALALPQVGSPASQAIVFSIVNKFDSDSATLTYAVFTRATDGTVNIKTTGSSATVDAVSGTPFATVAAGDELFCRDAEPDAQRRYVVAKASGAQITVNAAVDWSRAGGYQFSYRTLLTGTGAGAGWFGVGNLADKTFSFGVEQLVATDVKIRLECITDAPGAQPITIYPPAGGSGQCGTGTITVPGATARCAYALAGLTVSRCRFGVITDVDDGDDTGANREDIWAQFSGVER